MILSDFQFTKQQPKYTFQLTPHQQILLMPIGDVHFGSEGWPTKRFKDHIQWGVDRGAYFLGMGEYLDFTSTSQREHLGRLRPSQRQQIDEMVKGQVDQLYTLMGGSTGRWLGLLEGHHYHEFVDQTTSDQYLCSLLKAPFFGTSVLLQLRLNTEARKSVENRKGDARNGCDVLVYAHHGSGGGRRGGSHLHRVEDLMNVIEADIYLMGHSHSKISNPVDKLYSTAGGYLYHRTKICARTGGFLRGYAGSELHQLDEPAYLSRGSYVEAGTYTPSSLGGLVLSLGHKRVNHGPNGSRCFYIPDIHYSV